MAYRLETLLELRQRAEEEAEKALAAAIAERARTDAEQARLEGRAAEAAERLRKARSSSPAANVADGLARERFRQRLADEAHAAAVVARAHREGALAAAVSAEEQARSGHREARREREALDKHKAREEERLRTIGERRAEDALGDLALAAHLRKPRG